jgi:uncharacterized iron-regulated membrane protein
MTIVQHIAIWLSGAAALWGVAGGVYGLIAILKNRDRWYSAHHTDFTNKKQRVERDLNRGRRD